MSAERRRKSSFPTKLPARTPSPPLPGSPPRQSSPAYSLDKLIAQSQYTFCEDWHSKVDLERHQVIWYQLDCRGVVLKVTKEIRVKQQDDVLVPSVYLASSRKLFVDSGDIARVLGRQSTPYRNDSNISCWEDVAKLLEYARHDGDWKLGLTSESEASSAQDSVGHIDADADSVLEVPFPEAPGEGPSRPAKKPRFSPSSLNQTPYQYSKEWAFVCPVCKEGFISLDWMKRHVSIHHHDDLPTCTTFRVPDSKGQKRRLAPVYAGVVPDQNGTSWAPRGAVPKFDAAKESERQNALMKDYQRQHDQARRQQASRVRLLPVVKGVYPLGFEPTHAGTASGGKIADVSKPFPCSFCDKRFIEARFLNLHVRVNHPSNGARRDSDTLDPWIVGKDASADGASSSKELTKEEPEIEMPIPAVTSRELTTQLEWSVESLRAHRQRKTPLQSTMMPLGQLGFPQLTGGWCLRVVPLAETGWSSLYLVLQEPRCKDASLSAVTVFLARFSIDAVLEDGTTKRLLHQERKGHQKTVHPLKKDAREREWGNRVAIRHADLFGDNSYLVDGALKLRAEIEFALELINSSEPDSSEGIPTSASTKAGGQRRPR